jgi:glycosyltransferase involved in cell wall biosynthesis
MDFEYLKAVYTYKKINKLTKTYCAIDDQWKNTLRQKIGTYIYKLFLNKKVFDYMWVAGSPQLYYASNFGVKYNQVISGLLVASSKFNGNPNKSRRFVYVGRFVNVKGIDLLISAHKLLDINIRNKWQLELIGSGPLVNIIKDSLDEFITYKGPLFGEDLALELSKGGVGCCVSLHEPWGVVVHEYCLNSMPLILSNTVGSNSEFLINELNGFIFESSSVDGLYNSLLKIVKLSDDEYYNFGQNSKRLSTRITINDSIYKFLFHQ